MINYIIGFLAICLVIYSVYAFVRSTRQNKCSGCRMDCSLCPFGKDKKE